MRKFSWTLLLITSLLTLSCGGGSSSTGSTSSSCTDQQLSQLEQSMTTTLASAVTDTDFTLLLESGDGRSYQYSRGSSTSATSYQSASSSKLVTAVVILSLVDRGLLSLDSKATDILGWTPPAGNPATQMTLRHLLSFTSGFWDESLCLNNPAAAFASCVQSIYDTNIAENTAPGSEFYYASTHLQIAGMMAISADGYADWTELFDDFKARTGLFPNSVYDLPSATNPRLAGGMHWTAEDYLAFLRALYKGQILSPAMTVELWGNQRGTASVGNSPIYNAMGEDWGYALGNWAECTSSSYDCGTTLNRNSSPGAYGAYPFIDFHYNYYGILARQGALGTFPNGINLFRTVEETAGKWATRTCS